MLSTTIDRFCQCSVESLDLLKIDVEGAELKVLKGAEESLQRYVPSVLVEVHPSHLEKQEESPQEIAELLFRHGYAVEKLVEEHENEEELRREKISSSAGFSPQENTMLYAEPTRS